MRARRLGKVLTLVGVGAAWSGVIGAGFALLQKYETTPGRAAISPRVWPAESEIPFRSGQANLVMVLHPHCPCSRASIAELAKIMTRCQGRLNCHVIFVKPPGFPVGWERTDLWRQAVAIPGVTVSCDEEGLEARRFEAVTSGQVFFYEPHGQLVFSGGVTLARGHEGDNPGRVAILRFLTEGRGELPGTPVFGCPLFDPFSLDEKAPE